MLKHVLIILILWLTLPPQEVTSNQDMLTFTANKQFYFNSSSFIYLFCSVSDYRLILWCFRLSFITLYVSYEYN